MVSKMKNLFKTLSLILVFLAVQSCKEEELIVERGQSVVFKNLDAILPIGYDAKILNYTADDYGQIINANSANARTSSNEVSVDLNELAEMTHKLEKEYPDLSNMEDREIEKALRYFNKLDKKGVHENRETIMEFFDKLIGYDLAVQISKKVPTHSNKRVSDYPYGLNSCEIQFLIDHPRFVDGAQYATNKAVELEAQKFPGSGGDDTHPNAFRHAIWNTLLAKHGGKKYGSVSKAIETARMFSFLHEACGTGTDLQHTMDLHNNEVGLSYFASVGYTYTVSCFLGICNNNVTGPDDQVMADAVYAKPVIQAYSVSEINSTNNNTLVKLQ